MASKSKTVYVCRQCGAESPKWMGRCPKCGEWESMAEISVPARMPAERRAQSPLSMATLRPTALSQIECSETQRTSSGNGELDRVLGGGIVPGALILIGGEPGIGKSTLVLQMAINMPQRRVLYVSGEESAQQIRLRAERIHSTSADNCFIVSDTHLENILSYIDDCRPDIVIVDSIQTMENENVDSLPGSISQIRESTSLLMHVSKERNLPIILIGHINKEGSLAGPKVLEHMVDVVLQFEGDRNHMYRILRSIKNRFGSTDEIGIFEMQNDGLREVHNPSELLLSQHEQALSGIAISAAMEGMRPFLIEVQALVSTAAYGTPQRSATGFDIRRLNMLLAVLEKRADFKLAAKDVFLNIAGGIRVNDTATDLAVIGAILSSNTDLAINQDVCLAGEVGLSGEIRPVTRIEQRIGEAAKLGFKTIIVPRFNGKNDFGKFGISVCQASKLTEAFKVLFG